MGHVQKADCKGMKYLHRTPLYSEGGQKCNILIEGKIMTIITDFRNIKKNGSLKTSDMIPKKFLAFIYSLWNKTELIYGVA